MKNIFIRRLVLLIFSTMLVYGILYFLDLESMLYWENLYYTKIGASSVLNISSHLIFLLVADIAIIAMVYLVIYAVKRLRRKHSSVD